MSSPRSPRSPRSPEATTLCLTDKIRLEDGRHGTIKFIGEIEGKSGIFYGIEVSRGKGTNSGNHGTRQYFPCRTGHGVFVSRGRITSSRIQDRQSPRVNYGMRVHVDGKGAGLVKYIGYPAFKNHERAYVGIELTAPNGRSDGTYRGEFYFTSSESRGLFLPLIATPSRYSIISSPREGSPVVSVTEEKQSASMEDSESVTSAATSNASTVPIEQPSLLDAKTTDSVVSFQPGIYRQFSMQADDLEEMTAAVHEIPGIERACIVYVPHSNYARRPIVVAEISQRVSYGVLFRHLRKGFDCFLPDDLVIVDDFPLSEDGDIDRTATLNRVLDAGYVHPTSKG